MKITLIPLVGALLALAACTGSTETGDASGEASTASQETAQLPEIRYYMIADA